MLVLSATVEMMLTVNFINMLFSLPIKLILSNLNLQIFNTNFNSNTVYIYIYIYIYTDNGPKMNLCYVMLCYIVNIFSSTFVLQLD